MTDGVDVKIVVGDEGLFPRRANRTDAGMDLRAQVPSGMEIPPGGSLLIPTGVRVSLPQGTFGMIVPRSGLGIRGITLTNGTGIIDSEYRGQIMVSLKNGSPEVFQLERGDRIAQMIIVPFVVPNLIEVDSLEDTERGDGGFGSTGVK